MSTVSSGALRSRGRGKSDLSGGSDSFEYAKVDNEPGQHKQPEQLPANPSGVLDTAGHLQELMTEK